MGDFNFEPTTDQYGRIGPAMTPPLWDSWLVKWPEGKDTPGFPADERIDYIFVSPANTNVIESEYVPDPDSDHPYLYTVIQP